MSVNTPIQIRSKSGTNKPPRKADWSKIKKTLRNALFGPVLFALIVFPLTYFTDETHNSVRRTVALNPYTTKAKVVVITRGSATYEFQLNGKTVVGRSILGFSGNIGQTVCIKYSMDKPDVSLLCDEIELENPLEDSFQTSVMIFTISLLFTNLPLIWQLASKDKKTIAELTSRRNS